MTRPAPTTPSPSRSAASAKPNRTGLFATTTVIFLITSLILLWAVISPKSSPVKTPALRQAAQTSTEDQIKTLATRFATNLSTFNYQTVDADITKLEADVTDSFKTTRQAALEGTVDDFKSNIVSKKSVSRGTVDGTSVTSLDADTATVLVVVSQTYHNSTSGGDRTALHVVELTIVKNNGWKVDQVGNPPTS